MLAIVVFFFLTAATMLASSQITHANRVTAEYGKLQAINAAEAGVFATFVASTGLPRTVLAAGEPAVAYETTMMPPEPEGDPFWISSTGRATLAGFTYEARARAFVSEGSILLWEFE
jgi:hypothetical protein